MMVTDAAPRPVLPKPHPAEAAENLLHAALRQAVEGFNAAAEGARVGLGMPAEEERAVWFPFARLSEEGFGGAVIERIAETTNATQQAAATYTLRYAFYTPLMFAGYVFASRRWALSLEGSLFTANREWLNHVMVCAPALTMLTGDPLARRVGCAAADAQGLADALFAAMKRLVEPVIEGWAARKLVARANAWAIAVDSLACGMQLAGRNGVGLDAAWALWDAAIAGRVFPVRRRPRRFRFMREGEQDELLVRSGCCLWFTQPAAQASPTRYCASCYIQTDEARLEQITAYRKKQNSDA